VVIDGYEAVALLTEDVTFSRAEEIIMRIRFKGGV
jgi:hypothetical protein